MTERITLVRGERVRVVGSSVVGPQGPAGSGAGGVSDGDKGDIVVSAGGTVWSIEAGAVTAAKVAADVATQAELDAHTSLTTAAHGGIVAATDPRLSDARPPTAHSHTSADLPTATTAGTGVVELATTAETTAGVDAVRAVTPAGLAAVISALVNASPATLDTLNELAAALGNDPNFATTVATALAGKQPLDADLTQIAGLVSAADKLPYATGAQAWSLATLTAFARSLLDDVDAATARGTLGLGTAATQATGAFATAAQGVKADSAVQPTIVDAKGDLIVATANDTPARLAVGGTNGHVLTVDSAEATGLKWAAASGGGGGEPSPFVVDVGTWHASPYYSSAGTTGNLVILNRAYATPFYAPVSRELKEIALEVLTGGQSGNVIRLGVFGIDADAMLGTLIGQGTVAVDTLGVKVLTFGTALTIPAGLFYIAAVEQGTVGVTSIVGATSIRHTELPGYGHTTAGSVTLANLRTQIVLYRDGVSGAFTSDPVMSADVGSNRCPFLVVRYTA